MQAIEFYYNNVYSHYKTIDEVTDGFLRDMFYRGKHNEIVDFTDVHSGNKWKVKFIKY